MNLSNLKVGDIVRFMHDEMYEPRVVEITQLVNGQGFCYGVKGRAGQGYCGFGALVSLELLVPTKIDLSVTMHSDGSTGPATGPTEFMVQRDKFFENCLSK